MSQAHNTNETQNLDAKTLAAVREWLRSFGGDVEKTARWMRDSLGVAGLAQCRAWVMEAKG